jgi:hypothetical protein
MQYVVPVFGLVLVLLAAYTVVAECKKSLIASRGDLSVLRPFAMGWLVLFTAVVLASLALKYPALYVATGALIVIAWIAIPCSLLLSRRIRAEVGKR